jgi:hypothetical protein
MGEREDWGRCRLKAICIMMRVELRVLQPWYRARVDDRLDVYFVNCKDTRRLLVVRLLFT